MSDTIGFHARIVSGGEVYRIRDGKPTVSPIKGALYLGDELSVPTLFGRCIATVTECGDDKATAESGDTLCWLAFGEDDRRCWTCAVSGSKRALTSVLW